MRSRYSAYSIGLPDYLLRSWHSTTRPRTLELDADIRWRRLDIVATSDGGLFDSEGVVEFEAHFVRGEGASRERGVQAERSRFVREGGRWVYLDGVRA
jgi:SEC-C motif-containing protein